MQDKSMKNFEYPKSKGIDYATFFSGVEEAKKERFGYGNFFSFIWLFIRLNRKAKKFKYSVNYTVRLPIRWIK